MKKGKNDIDILNQIEEMLKPMYDVLIEVQKSGKVHLLKDGKKFGYIENKNIYFLGAYGDFAKLSEDILSDKDEVLRLATKSYWLASGK